MTVLSSDFRQIQATAIHANTACTYQFAKPELGVAGVLKRNYWEIQAK